LLKIAEITITRLKRKNESNLLKMGNLRHFLWQIRGALILHVFDYINNVDLINYIPKKKMGLMNQAPTKKSNVHIKRCRKKEGNNSTSFTSLT